MNCDSTITIDLVFNLSSVGEETHNGCFNDGYSVVVNGITYNEGNPTGMQTLTNAVGCDSLVNINLEFNSFVTGSELYQGCVGDGYSVTVNNTLYNESNPTGTETLASVTGCDSIVDINLIFSNGIVGSIFGGDPICQGDETNLILALEGASTYDLVISDGNGMTISLNGVLDGDSIIVNPTATTIYTIESLSAPGNSCTPVLPSATATITVNDVCLLYTSPSPRD